MIRMVFSNETYLLITFPSPRRAWLLVLWSPSHHIQV